MNRINGGLSAAAETEYLRPHLEAAVSIWRATNGYLIHGIGTRAKALAGADVALPLDALTAGTNPAGMAWLGKRFDAGLALFNPNRKYTVSGAPSQFPGTFGLVPGTVESGSDLFFVPNFGGNWAIGNDSTFGLAVFGQGGMNSDYGTSTFFGSSPTGVDLSQLFIVPSYTRKVGELHSVGITPIIAYQQFEAQGLEAFGQFSSNPSALTNNGADRSIGYGLKVGYLGQWTDSLYFGLSYQTKVSMEEFDSYAGLFAQQGGTGATWSVPTLDRVGAVVFLSRCRNSAVRPVPAG